jgi:hypothetical protein
MAAPGNFVMYDSEVEGDERAKEYLVTTPKRVNDWLYELVDATIFFAADRLRVHAPGGIDSLVGVDLPHELEPGRIDGTAGVEPDITEETFMSGLGSDPADYPVFVDVGTGIFGPERREIFTIPGHVMGPISWQGREIFVSSFKGQKAQHYSDRAYEDTTAWLPAKVELAKRDLGSPDG